MITENQLEELYIDQKLSMFQISKRLGCSVNRIVYWMNKYKIKRRTISDAVYVRSNPMGDPFTFNKPESNRDYMLMGIGLGLYWGEGTKSNPHSVRLGNTDPGLYSCSCVSLFSFSE